ncbi:hypothetical protein DPEC_G00282200 [Dallia pectoralis]|uniref:Uncharacterized protein n=1 Tax=Dallia pectoralis TaxID=75939 RepID=A0ACC2FNG3_DALPE|nr:hypothetical protein DPEC_G00282200 [Dallia pectoralis]
MEESSSEDPQEQGSDAEEGQEHVEVMEPGSEEETGEAVDEIGASLDHVVLKSEVETDETSADGQEGKGKATRPRETAATGGLRHGVNPRKGGDTKPKDSRGERSGGEPSGEEMGSGLVGTMWERRKFPVRKKKEKYTVG